MHDCKQTLNAHIHESLSPDQSDVVTITSVDGGTGGVRGDRLSLDV